MDLPYFDVFPLISCIQSSKVTLNFYAWSDVWCVYATMPITLAIVPMFVIWLLKHLTPLPLPNSVELNYATQNYSYGYSEISTKPSYLYCPAADYVIKQKGK